MATTTTDARATFTERASALGARVLDCDLASLLPLVSPLCDRPGGVGVSGDLLARLPGLAELVRPGDGWPLTAVTRAQIGIAALGSITLSEVDRSDRLLHLLAGRHIALLPSSGLLPSLEAAVPVINGWITDGPRYVTLVGGPSRTSDIEKILTIGVHGPGELTIILVDDWRPDED